MRKDIQEPPQGSHGQGQVAGSSKGVPRYPPSLAQVNGPTRKDMLYHRRQHTMEIKGATIPESYIRIVLSDARYTHYPSDTAFLAGPFQKYRGHCRVGNESCFANHLQDQEERC